MTTSEPLRELEHHLAWLSHARGGQTYIDMWEHFAARGADNETRAKMAADLARCNQISAESRAAVEAIVGRLRVAAPHLVAAWCEAHDAYLASVVAHAVARGEAGHTDATTAARERGAWAAIRDGTSSFVNESVPYPPELDARYRELFGFDVLRSFS